MRLGRGTRMLLTGGSGFIGTNLIAEALQRGMKVSNFDIAPPFDNEHRRHWTRGDVCDVDAVQHAIGSFRPDVVVHMAGRVDVVRGSIIDDYAVNVRGTSAVLSAVQHAEHVRRLIVTSTQFVCRPGYFPRHDEDYAPHTAYGESKVHAERLTRAADLRCDWFIVRPTTVWGPWDLHYRRQFYRVMEWGLYFHPSGQPAIRSLGFVGNVVSQIRGLLQQPSNSVKGRVFYLGDPCADIREYVDEYSRQLHGKPVRVVPRNVVARLGRLGDVLQRVGVPFPLSSSRYSSMTQDYPVPLDRTLALTGPGPYPLSEGVDITLSWLRDVGVIGSSGTGRRSQ